MILSLIGLSTDLENYYKKKTLSLMGLSTGLEKNLKSRVSVISTWWIIKIKLSNSLLNVGKLAV